jgi:hypothetical protein
MMGSDHGLQREQIGRRTLAINRTTMRKPISTKLPVCGTGCSSIMISPPAHRRSRGSSFSTIRGSHAVTRLFSLWKARSCYATSEAAAGPTLTVNAYTELV